MTTADKRAAGTIASDTLPASPERRQSSSSSSSGGNGVGRVGSQMVQIPGAEQVKTMQRQTEGRGGKKRIQQ